MSSLSPAAALVALGISLITGTLREAGSHVVSQVYDVIDVGARSQPSVLRSHRHCSSQQLSNGQPVLLFRVSGKEQLAVVCTGEHGEVNFLNVIVLERGRFGPPHGALLVRITHGKLVEVLCEGLKTVRLDLNCVVYIPT